MNARTSGAALLLGANARSPALRRGGADRVTMSTRRILAACPGKGLGAGYEPVTVPTNTSTDSNNQGDCPERRARIEISYLKPYCRPGAEATPAIQGKAHVLAAGDGIIKARSRW